MDDSCSNCGAKFVNAPTTSPAGGFDFVCTYCGGRKHLPPAPPTEVRVHLMTPQPYTPLATTPGAGGAGVAASVAVIALLGLGMGVYFAVRGASGASGGPTSSDDGTDWDEVGGPPVVATIGGSEAIVGRMRNVQKGDQLYVAAFDGATLKQHWRAGPFGTYSDGYQSTLFAVSGSHVVVTDFHSNVHVLDLATGKEQRVIKVTDKVSSACAVAPNKVWLEQVDKRNVMLDTDSGAVSEAPQPDGCMTADQRFMNEAGSLGRSDSLKTLPKIQGFEATMTFDTADGRVVYGKKSPGTPTPLLVGLDKKTSAVKWRSPVAAVDDATVRDEAFEHGQSADLHGNRFVTAYGVGQKAWHITAFDAKTGARQWDTTLKAIFAVDWLYGVTCTATRVYVVRMESIDVLDASTGKPVGTIGTETYEDDMK